MYPIISAHFSNSDHSEDTFAEMLQKSIGLYEIYNTGGEFTI